MLTTALFPSTSTSPTNGDLLRTRADGLLELLPTAATATAAPRTWSWTLPCAAGTNTRPTCVARSSCFRAVYDGLFAPGEIAALRSAGPQVVNALATRIGRLLAENHGIVEPMTMSASYELVGNGQGWVLHSDLVTDPGGSAISALLYMSRAAPGSGGATIFVDQLTGNRTGAALINAPDGRGVIDGGAEPEATRGVVERGTLVYPTPGRLVLFSGGLENVHVGTHLLAWAEADASPRRVLALWFGCEHADESSTPRGHDRTELR